MQTPLIDGRHRAKTKMFHWFLRESMDNLSLVWLSPPPTFPEKTVLAQASGPPTVGFAKAGLEHSETTSST